MTPCKVDIENKYINRFNSFCKSLEGLLEAKNRDGNDDFVLNGTAYKFSMTFDISWKVMKDIIVKYHKVQTFATGSPRETLRTANSVGLISDDIWMDMLDDRNNLAHDYDGEMAKDCFERIVGEYTQVFVKFKEKAQYYMKEMQKEDGITNNP